MIPNYICIRCSVWATDVIIRHPNDSENLAVDVTASNASGKTTVAATKLKSNFIIRKWVVNWHELNAPSQSVSNFLAGNDDGEMKTIVVINSLM